MPDVEEKSKTSTDITDHLLTLQEIVRKYDTNVNPEQPLLSEGLTRQQCDLKLKQFGLNELPPPRKTPWYFKYLNCLVNLFNLLLIAAGTGNLILYAFNSTDYYNNVYIGSILIGIAFINATIEFIELMKIAALIKSFNSLVPSKSNVIRDKQNMEVLSSELVPGDVLFLKAGNKVPADCILFHSNDFKVDNANLTGESEVISKRACKGANITKKAISQFGLTGEFKRPEDEKDPMQSPYLVFSATVVVAGEGHAIVLRTGEETVFGKISKLVRPEKTKKSPLSREIRRFTKLISFMAISIALLLFIVAWARSQHFNYSLQFAIGILVAWVPQGLPLTLTMLLTVAARRMTKQNVLVKDLHGVETLGAITMLCTDKTGTLTQNKMAVSYVWTNMNIFFAGEDPSAMPSGEKMLRLDISGVTQMLHIASTCTRAKFDCTDVPLEQRQIFGDATDAGLYRWASQKLANMDKLSDLYPKIFEIPYSSETKMHLTIHRKAHRDGGLTLLTKGAPERILELSTSILIDGKPQPLTEAHKQAFWQAYERLSHNGHRVLAFAQGLLPGSKYPDNFKFSIEKDNWPRSDLCFIGLVGMDDPPKHGVREAIGQMRMAGIKVVMITGDHPLTAENLARRINLMVGDTKKMVAQRTGRPESEISNSEYSSIVLKGNELEDLTDEDWDTIFTKEEIIFARTTPQQKVYIVEKAQGIGHIVGVTGDGVNDSAALKTADLGISMNKTGSDASKEAAGMIIMDDNFATIVKGIAQGRLIFLNMKKSVQYCLTHIVPEVIPNILYVLVPIPLALTAIQILVVDLGFEIFNTLSFAFEPPEYPDLMMKLPPRRPVSYEVVSRLRAKKKEADLRASQDVLRSQNFGSIDALKDDLGSVALLANVDNDEDFVVVSRWKRYWLELRAIFHKTFWKGKARDLKWMIEESSKEERLVDGEVLTWAYLIGGIIECTGALMTFFFVLYFSFGIDPNDGFRAMRRQKVYFRPHSPSLELNNGGTIDGPGQVEALRQAQSAFYLSILIIQIWNLFACKARVRLPFGQFMFMNTRTWIAIFTGSSLAFFIVYTPGVNGIFLEN